MEQPDKEKEEYKETLKNTSLFGGVQIYWILTSIVESKVVAIILGPEGMGILGLLKTTVRMIASSTNLSLGICAVKNIASANSTKNWLAISETISVFRRLIFFTGLLGLLSCAVLSPFWSVLTFGDYSYTLTFVFLSVTLFIDQQSTGQNTLLQGMQRFRWMAKSKIYSSTAGLFFSIPLYYWKGEKAIVVVIIIASLINLLLSWHFSKRIKLPKIKLDLRLVLSKGKEMLHTGFFFSLKNFLPVTSAYLIRTFINHRGGIADVGLFYAGFALVNTYSGLVLSAMATDYYPRLSVARQTDVFNTTINRQMEVGILLISPLIILFTIYSDILIQLLYSTKFLAINSMLYWMMLGVFFQVMSWTISFSFLAKSDGKGYFINELVSNIYLLILNVSFYYEWGLTGLGVSFLIGYIIYFIQVFMVCHQRFNYRFSMSILPAIVKQFIICLCCFLLIFFASTTMKYILGTLLLIISLYFSLNILNQRMGLKDILKNQWARFNKK